MLGIFCADILFAYGLVIEMGYILVVVGTLWIPGRRITWFFSICTTVLIFMAKYLAESKHMLIQDEAFFLWQHNLWIAVAMIWVCAGLVDKFHQVRRAQERKLFLLSIQDELTHVYNRRYFLHRLNIEWAKHIRSKQYLSLLLLDIDFFKKYNDKLGHQAGDQCLKRVAETIDRHVNRGDDFVARYGGEEFVVVLPTTPKEGAIKVANDIQHGIEALAALHPDSSVSPYLTVSIGVTTLIPNAAQDTDLLLYQADNALYQAKQLGRNRNVYFEPQSSKSK